MIDVQCAAASYTSCRIATLPTGIPVSFEMYCLVNWKGALITVCVKDIHIEKENTLLSHI